MQFDGTSYPTSDLYWEVPSSNLSQDTNSSDWICYPRSLKAYAGVVS